MSEQNKAVVRRWLEEAWNQGKAQVLDEICANDYVEYDPAYPGGQARRDGVKQAIPMYRSAFPDLRFVIEDMIAEGDKVAAYWRLTATNLGAIRGMPPTGKRGEAEGMTLVRLRDGKSVEAHSCYDLGDFRQQLGIAPPPEAAERA